jgi:SprT protein
MSDRWSPRVDASLRDALQLELEAWCAVWGLPELAQRVRIDVSARFTSSLGRAYYRTCCIKLHAQLLEPERATLLREVLAHEAAHLAADMLHGRRIRPHGREWRDTFRAIGFVPRVTVPLAETGIVMPERRTRRRHRRRVAVRRSAARRIIQWLLPF